MCRKRRGNAFGFTLVELMVTIVVLAIIASIGWPLYTGILLKGRRVEARAGLKELAMMQDWEMGKWGGYSEPNAAVPGITAADGAPAPDAASSFMTRLTRISNQHTEFYTFNIEATDTTYTITATPVDVQAEDAECAFFSVDSMGVKDATDVDLCW